MNERFSKMMDIEIENIKRFAEMVDGTLDIIKEHTGEEVVLIDEIENGVKGGVCAKGYSIDITLTIPLCLSIRIHENKASAVAKDIMTMTNMYGNITGRMNGNLIMDYNLSELDIAITNYWYKWYKEVWNAPYNFDENGNVSGGEK